MIKQEIIIDNKQYDEFLKVLSLTEPENGHEMLSFFKATDSYFSSKKCLVKRINSNNFHMNIIDYKKSYIQYKNYTITIKELMNKLLDDDKLEIIMKDIIFNNKTTKCRFFKVVNKFDKLK